MKRTRSSLLSTTLETYLLQTYLNSSFRSRYPSDSVLTEPAASHYRLEPANLPEVPPSAVLRLCVAEDPRIRAEVRRTNMYSAKITLCSKQNCIDNQNLGKRSSASLTGKNSGVPHQHGFRVARRDPGR
jgi:hypothetical protein